MSLALTSGNPRVSVLMTAYNREDFIAESIESVLRSTFLDFELIIVDNASEDNTFSVAEKYSRDDGRVRVYRNEENIGDFPNRGRAASYARGAYLKYVDSDDLLYPHGLEVMVKCVKAFPRAGLGLSALPDIKAPCPLCLTPAEAYREHFFRADLLSRAPGSAIIRREAFEAVGGFSGRRYIGDVELWLKVAARFDVVKMPTDLIWDRVHPGQEQHTQDRIDWIIMRENEEIGALESPQCPLNDPERTEAIDRVRSKRAATYWNILRGGGGIGQAERYRERTALPLSSLAGFAWKRSLGNRFGKSKA